MRPQEVMNALATGDAQIVDVTDRLSLPSADTHPTDPMDDYEHQVTLG